MDEQRETTLKDVLWNVSRTGLINPIAVFDPVELEGTTVSRASVHNLSIVRELALGTGDTIKVYKCQYDHPANRGKLDQKREHPAAGALSGMREHDRDQG